MQLHRSIFTFSTHLMVYAAALCIAAALITSLIGSTLPTADNAEEKAQHKGAKEWVHMSHLTLISRLGQSRSQTPYRG